MTTTLSKQGAAFIAAFEGCVLHCYDDGGKPGVGNCTIGVGHLVHMGPTTAHDRIVWGTITRDRAFALLQQDAAKAAAGVDQFRALNLTQAQKDALICFAFNCGTGALTGAVGTAVKSKPKTWNLLAMRRWHNRVRDALLLWDHAGGVVLAGLERRRRDEATLFATGKYVTA